MKKEAAADEEGKVDAAVMGAGSAAWLEPLSRQGARVLLLVVVFVMVVTEASEAVTSLSESPIKPQACWHMDTEIRQLKLVLPTHPLLPPLWSPLLQMNGQLLQTVPVSGSQQYPQQRAPRWTAWMLHHLFILATLTRLLWL